MVWCTGCLQERPEEDFLPDRWSDSWPRSRCRACRSGYAREWRARNPEAVAAYNEARRIGARECVCVDCGGDFTAGRRGPASTRCAGCRAKAKRPNRRRARVCEICGSRYSPSYKGQRTCGRSCGGILRDQRNGEKAAA
jgi:hypothetical protein